MIRVLVSGGAGFIGSNFVRYMLRGQPENEIVNLDSLTYAGNPANLEGLEKNKNYRFVKGDICNAKLVGKLMRGTDWVVNFAAESHVDRSIRDAGEFIRTNILGVQVLLDAAREHNVQRFMQISTDEVYGSIEKGRFREGDALHPRNPYSASKAAADKLVGAYHETYGIETVITRSSNNFGPYQFPEKAIPLFITNLLRGKKVPLYGDGLNVREWTYVEDNCRAIGLVLRKGKGGETYNIGSGEEMTNLALTKAILRELGEGEGMIEHVEDRPGHDRRYSLDSGKVRALGWKPEARLGENLHGTVEWYKRNKKWWEPLVKRRA